MGSFQAMSQKGFQMKEVLREEMKRQTIGVEVEMNNISRQRAAEVAADYFGTHNYRYEGGTYRVWAAFDAQGRKWNMEYDSSISGDSDEKCEMVTPILHYEDIELLQGLVRAMREAGAKSSPRRGCGVHIHIGAVGHTPQTLRNLVNVMASHENLLAGSVGIADSRLHQWCKVVDRRFLAEVNKKKPQTMEQFADVWYQSQNEDYGRYQHYNGSRYHMLNLHAVFTKGTIEFRAFQFDNWHGDGKGCGLHAGKLKAYIQLCLAISNYAKCVKYASPKIPSANVENPKFGMRVWMKQMGMIGEEYSTARVHLMDKLPGKCANRRSANVVAEGLVA